MSRILFIAGISIAGAIILRTFLVEGIYVASASMEPTLSIGNHYFAEKISYKFRKPARGEIVVLESPVRKKRYIVKRIIALPCERIKIENKNVFIDGKLLSEPYVRHSRDSEILEGDNLPEITVPENSYFVLGDNRDESDDSSVWKDQSTGERVYFVPERNIKSRLIILFN